MFSVQTYPMTNDLEIQDSGRFFRKWLGDEADNHAARKADKLRQGGALR